MGPTELFAPTIRNADFLGTDARKLFAVCSADPDTYGPGDFEGPDSVQEAIDAAAPGAAIFVKPGTYNKILVDTAGLKIVGAGYYNPGGVLFDGGVLGHAVNVTGSMCELSGFSAQTTGGGGQNYDGIYISGAWTNVHDVQIPDADRAGMYLTTGGYVSISRCIFRGADGQNLLVNAPICRAENNLVLNGTYGIYVDSSGDNSVIVGNVVQNASVNPIYIHGDAENCVVVGNRTDGAVVDNSATSTVTGNDETAF